MSEIRRGWLLIVATGIGVATSSVVLPFYTIGALVKPLTVEFAWSRADVQSALLFNSCLGALTAPVVGWLNDRYGSRVLALCGLVGLALGLFIAATMNGQLWVFYLAYSCMALLGAGTSPVTWTRAIASSFDRQRGLALGFALTGSGVCAMLAPLFAVRLVEGFGWRVAYVGIGALPILLAGPIVWFGFKPVTADARRMPSIERISPETGLRGLTLGEAVRGYRFWVLCGSILAVYLANSGISPNLIAALTDRGFSAPRAASAQGTFGFAIIIGRLAAGFFIDRFWAPGVALVTLSLPAVGCLILAGSPDFAWVETAAFLIGFAAGAELDFMAYLCARYFGLRHFATIYAILFAVCASAGGTAPMLFAHWYDRTKSYRLSFLIAAALFLAGAVALPLLGRYPVAWSRTHTDGTL